MQRYLLVVRFCFLVDNTDASGTGTYPVKIRFMSAQRGKKTRSAASRYLRLRLENINRRLLFLKCHPQKEEGKDTLSEKCVPACEVLSTPQRIAYTPFADGWVPGHRAVLVPWW